MEIALCILAASQSAVVIVLAWVLARRVGTPDWRAASYFAENHVRAYEAGIRQGSQRPDPQASFSYSPAPDPTVPADPPTREYQTPEDQPQRLAQFGYVENPQEG